jgi:protein-L-isoaspartate O-methyltransferase
LDRNEPAAWLVENLDVLPRGGRVLDVACGRGHHARFLAQRGWQVHAIDRDPGALSALNGVERVTTELVDLEHGTPSLGERCYDAVIVFRYLHRPLMPALVQAVADDGVLVYETFTRGQALRGHPKNPAFLLDEGELPALVAPLKVLRSREGDFDGTLLSSVVAVRP